MEKIVVKCGSKINGCVNIGGSKNAALPLMVASLLAEGQTVLCNVPNIKDIHVMGDILEGLGVTVQLTKDQAFINVPKVMTTNPSDDLVKQIRGSVYLLGSLLARTGEATIAFPGGCAWGPRPINFHIDGLRALGAMIKIEDGHIKAYGKLSGSVYHFPQVSVGATITMLLAAITAKGQTKLTNCATEPEITNLVDMLIDMGSHIEGRGTRTLIIKGVEGFGQLKPVAVEVIPDIREVGTYMAAAAITSGTLLIQNCEPAHVKSITDKMRQAGCTIEERKESLLIRGPTKLKPVNIVTEAYPGFPTDMQPQWMAIMTVAEGNSTVTETVFKDRFAHVGELKKLGADITVAGNIASIKGRACLVGTSVECTDLRGGAAMIIAGLVARMHTTISAVHHLDRGYSNIEKTLTTLGAICTRR